MSNERVKGIIRLIVSAVLTVNMCLTLAGKNPIPFDEEQVTEVLTMIAAGLSGLWMWWKDNNITKKAQATKEMATKVATGEAVLTETIEVEDEETVTDLDSEYEKGDE